MGRVCDLCKIVKRNNNRPVVEVFPDPPRPTNLASFDVSQSSLHFASRSKSSDDSTRNQLNSIIPTDIEYWNYVALHLIYYYRQQQSFDEILHKFSRISTISGSWHNNKSTAISPVFPLISINQRNVYKHFIYYSKQRFVYKFSFILIIFFKLGKIFAHFTAQAYNSSQF